MQSAESSATFRTLARLGYLVNGLLHFLIGYIALRVATGTSSRSADQSGALAGLGSAPGGAALLWIATLGLAALGVWQLVQSGFIPGSGDKGKLAHRLVDAGKGVVYFLLAYTAFTFAHGGSTSSSASTVDFSASLLKAPGGRFLLIAVGLVVVVIGIILIAKGATQKFTEDIKMPNGAAGKAVIAVGVAGYVAKGVVLGLVGVLFVVASVTYNPDKATGLDGALKSLAALPFGVVILMVTGLGLMAFGIYSCARAALARL